MTDQLMTTKYTAEEAAKEQLKELSRQGKIVLSTGLHGQIFMQICHTNNGLKAYETNESALNAIKTAVKQ